MKEEGIMSSQSNYLVEIHCPRCDLIIPATAYDKKEAHRSAANAFLDHCRHKHGWAMSITSRLKGFYITSITIGACLICGAVFKGLHFLGVSSKTSFRRKLMAHYKECHHLKITVKKI